MGVRYTYLNSPTADDKVAPQAAEILKVIKAADQPVSRDDVVKALEESGVLKTRQPVLRVVAYYQPQFVEKGYISVEKDAKAPKTPRKSKKAKAADPDEPVDSMEINEGDDEGDDNDEEVAA